MVSGKWQVQNRHNLGVSNVVVRTNSVRPDSHLQMTTMSGLCDPSVDA
jgi:hypothetical protein